jgi:peptidoglycan/xylan/chitin deacetylase (PgdA/CDA1 family)
VCLEEALQVLSKGTRRPAILITFDDGYLDNYSIAFPILKAHSATATFFLPTSFIGSQRVPWWDAIAFMLRGSKRQNFELRYPDRLTVDLRAFQPAVRSVLRAYKSPAMRDSSRFIDALAQATGVEHPHAAEKPLFMSWANVIEMANSGMSFGSHTHSHELLAKLTFEQQVWEMEHSRQCIRENTGIEVTTLAFPVGNPTTFSAETHRALADTRYEAAFSFYGGVNIPNQTNRLDIRRNAVTMDFSQPVMRWRVNRMLAGSGWPAYKAGRQSAGRSGG